MITITIPGQPFGKQRPRVSAAGRFARVYTPAETVNKEAFVKMCAVQQVKGHMLLEALAVTVQAIFCIPASWSQKKTKEAMAGFLRPTGKPDGDNIAKLYLDSLNGVVWKDDAQVVDLSVSKVYGPEPKTIITVRAI